MIPRHGRNITLPLFILVLAAGSFLLWLSPAESRAPDNQTHPAGGKEHSSPGRQEPKPARALGKDLRRILKPSPLAPLELTGVVIGDDSPIGNCRIYACRGDGTASTGASTPIARMGTRAEDAPEILGSTRSEKSGRFRIRLSRGVLDQPLDLVAMAPGFQRGGIQGVSAESLTGSGLLIRLERGHAISGTIRDTDGRAVPMIRVFACTDRIARGREIRNNHVVEQALGCSPALSSGFHIGTAHAQDSGEFRIEGLPPGKYVLNVGDPELVMVPHPVVSAGQTGIQLVVARGRRIRLRVLELGSKKPVATISALFTLGEKGGEQTGLSITGKNGLVDFTIDAHNVPPRMAHIGFQMTSKLHESVKGSIAEATPGGATQTVYMPPIEAHPVRLDVRDRVGAPERDIIVEALSLDGTTVVTVKTRPQKDGLVQAWLPAGDWRLWVRHRHALRLRNANQEREVRVSETGNVSPRNPVPFQLDHSSSVRLRFASGSKLHARLRSVSLSSKHGIFQFSADRLVRSRCHWTAIPAGRWHISIECKDNRSWTGSVDHRGGHSTVWIPL